LPWMPPSLVIETRSLGSPPRCLTADLSPPLVFLFPRKEIEPFGRGLLFFPYTPKQVSRPPPFHPFISFSGLRRSGESYPPYPPLSCPFLFRGLPYKLFLGVCLNPPPFTDFWPSQRMIFPPVSPQITCPLRYSLCP